MVIRLLQIAAPLLRAAEQPKLSLPTSENPPPEHPQVISPEKRWSGRRRSHTGTSLSFDWSAPWRRRAACQNSSERILNAGTSVMTQSRFGLRREIRLPVAGSLS